MKGHGRGRGMTEHLEMAISDEASLLAATDWLHDGVFRPEDARYDADACTFTLTIWREVPGRTVPTRVPLVRRHVDTWRRCCLTLKRVETAALSVSDPAVPLIFIELKYNSQTREAVVVECLEAMSISFRLAAIEGSLVDTGEIASDDDVGMHVARWPFAWPS